MQNTQLFTLLSKILYLLTTLGMCVYYTINRLKNDNQVESMDKHNQVNITFEERQKLICTKLSNDCDIKTMIDIIKSWIPINFKFTFKCNGEIYYARLKGNNFDKTMQKNEGADIFYLTKDFLNFIFAIGIITNKLIDQNILFTWNDIKRAPHTSLALFHNNKKVEDFNDDKLLEINGAPIFSLLSNQYYVDQEKLDRFIKHGYKTDDQIKESRDNKLYVIAIYAILVPIITTIIQVIVK
jgi:hypothetical protein